MKMLKGEILENDTVVNIFKMPFSDEKSFFVALVTLCDRFKVDIPIWTLREDKILNEKKEIIIPLEKESKMRLQVITQ
ncbi:hypothetical protein SAMN02745975_03477 [Geosporobacter subterraneus DSM 17957]|uniref:Uncharacterized protein n=1 Tax=Geosporobacter subterraneus DSM 17957 TaxID=1121919 RepID=A0A1M6P401_9FIRM|nr:hypothetical protein [Geosporobacter subterraneus]SHK02622.1 hypothetical protein SAMN02745975_03477 [Geosporobacter subterraneus DSM 17957]